MQNSYHMFENKFDKLYFHAKSKVKSKKYHKVKFHTSLKNCGHAESKILDWEQFWYSILPCKNLRLKAKNTINSSVIHH